ncbi:MAG: hypothetical protein ACU837_10550 [Gammaproteobacteria bacterium]
MSTDEQNQPEQVNAEDTKQPEQSTATETASAEAAGAETAVAAKAKAGAAAGQIFASLSKLKQQNPKVFYGAIGGLALVILYMMFSGNPEIISGPQQMGLTVGQTYTLQTPNVAGENPQVRMVSTPGQMEAYDDTEETDRQGCKTLPSGTRVTVKDLFKQPGMNFAKVEILDGECKGKTMWTLAVNLH